MSDYKLLKNIKGPDDLKKIPAYHLNELCKEIRLFLLETVSKVGGHLSSNLGVVELTVAIHKVFNSPVDKIVWDVGHQAYVHKLLTGRFDRFATIRTENGLSGFPKHEESEHDAFIAGHSSTSISVAFGLAKSLKLQKKPGHVIAVIGDGAMTSGIAYEALNNAGRGKEKLIIILNDNNMSISKNVGAIAKYLSKIRNDPMYFKMKDTLENFLEGVPVVGRPVLKSLISAKNTMKNLIYKSTFFEEFGFNYMGPVDGHDIQSLCEVLERAKNVDGPVIINVNTVKGKGYSFAEENPGAYHGISRFDTKTGNPDLLSGSSFSKAFGKELTKLAQKDDKIVAVTAAMTYGTELQHFAKAYKERFFDVGIAEGHAVTFCAGLACGGMTPVFAVYSTFLQRSYDQLIHDASIEKQHIILAIDRAGLVGEDGETHQGIFDVSFLSSIPGAVIYSPSNYRDLSVCLTKAIYEEDGVVGVRYPRGSEDTLIADLDFGTDDYYLHSKSIDADTAFVTYGRIVAEAYKAILSLENKNYKVDLVKLTKIFPIQEGCIDLLLKYNKILFFEEGVSVGGIGEHLQRLLYERGYKGSFQITGVDQFVRHSSVKSALKKLELDSEGIENNFLQGKKN